MANPVANTVDSISHAYFRSNFQTPAMETEILEMKQMRPSQLQIQDRGTHKYRQQIKDPVLQSDLQSNLQADLQKDLQADLQVRTDLQPDLQAQTGIEGTQHSSLVSFQDETSTERENLGGTCEQGPNHVSGELPRIYRDLHPTGIYTLQGSTRIHILHGSTRIYTLHRSTRIYTLNGSTRLTTSQDLHPNIQCSNPEHPAPPMGNPVTQSV